MKLLACVFETQLGWFGLAGIKQTVWRVTIGHHRCEAAWTALNSRIKDGELVEQDWYPKLQRKLVDFADGRYVTFDEIKIRDEPRTEFQQNVLLATRAIAFGETVSYGELAERVGSPRAARAVGTVMASNQIPIIVPCHRVVGARGTLTGFSAPRGIHLKQQLLELERTACEPDATSRRFLLSRT